MLENWYEVGAVKRVTESQTGIRNFCVHFTGSSLLLKNHNNDLRVRQ